MKTFNIQLQPERDFLVCKEEVVSLLNGEGLKPEIVQGNDDGPYINITFETKSVSGAWALLKEKVLGCKGVKGSAIITCQGSEGWDNYLLLYHFDLSLELDNVPSGH